MYVTNSIVHCYNHYFVYSFMSLRESLFYYFWFFSFVPWIQVPPGVISLLPYSFASTHLLCGVTVKFIKFLYVIYTTVYLYTYCFMKLLLTQLKWKGDNMFTGTFCFSLWILIAVCCHLLSAWRRSLVFLVWWSVSKEFSLLFL